MDRLENFVGGARVAPRSGNYVELINPSTGEAFTESPVSGPEDVDVACAAALEAFATWRSTTPSQRSRALLRIADAIESRADEIVALESQNTGKPVAARRSTRRSRR